MSQPSLFAAEEAELEAQEAEERGAWLEQPCNWYEDSPFSWGEGPGGPDYFQEGTTSPRLETFTHLLRGPDDPEPKSRKAKHEDGQGFESWRSDMKGSPRDWAAAIIRELRRAPHSLTFNALCLRLTGGQYTADVAGGQAPDVGLWTAVCRGAVLWTDEIEDRGVLFAAKPPGMDCHTWTARHCVAKNGYDPRHPRR